VQQWEAELSQAQDVAGYYEEHYAVPGYVGGGGQEEHQQQSGAVRRVGMVQHGQHGATSATPTSTPVAIGVSPALQVLQKEMKKPYFAGDSNYWTDFLNEWARYKSYMQLNLPAGEVGQVVLRDLFISCLGGVLHRKYSNETQLNPHKTYEDIMQEMQEEYYVDDPHYWRKRWRNVKLRWTGNELRVENWRLFQTEFELARQKVGDYTEQEDIDLVLAQLSESWRTRVLKAESKFASNFFMAKLQGPNLSEQQLGNVLTGLRVQVRRVDKHKSCYLVQLPCEDNLKRIMGLTGTLVGGTALQCTRVRKRWQSKDIFEFVAKELKVEKESKVLGGREDSHYQNRGRQTYQDYQQPQYQQQRYLPRYAAAVREEQREEACAEKDLGQERTATNYYTWERTNNVDAVRSRSSSRRPGYTPTCYTCRKAGRESSHYWLDCKWAAPMKEKVREEARKEKENIEAAAEKGGKEKGKGKGRGKGTGGGKGGGKSLH
jgi:hypothetical protein